MLAKAFNIMIQGLGLDQGLYSLHSLKRGGATSTNRAGADLLEVNHHGLWAIDAFWAYIMSPCTSTSPMASALVAVAAAANTL